MRTAFKVILVVVVLVVVVAVVFGAVLLLNLSAYTATGSEVKTPTSTAIGTAIVAYDPGLSGAAKNVAAKVTDYLVAAGYTVTFAGIKSSAVNNASSYDIIVAGGPVYGSSPTASVKDFLSSLNPTGDTVVGLFGSGSGSEAPEDIEGLRNAIAGLRNGAELSDAVVVKIGENEDLDVRTQDFVNRLTS